MNAAIDWLGFLGGWLLFAGPVFQASVELAADEEARRRAEETQAALKDTTPPVSNLWWLLPPVRLLLTSRRRNAQKQRVAEAMSPEDLDLVRNYIAIARGWMYVAGGALLIALKESWELAVHQEWTPLTYWLLVACMALFVVGAVGGDAERRERRERPRGRTPDARDQAP